jgi:hypothetical protein
VFAIWSAAAPVQQELEDGWSFFFTSVETASKYVAKHPGLFIVPVDQVYRIGQLL